MHLYTQLTVAHVFLPLWDSLHSFCQSVTECVNLCVVCVGVSRVHPGLRFEVTWSTFWVSWAPSCQEG